MQVENDILDLIRDLPSEINDTSTTTEMKFLTVGGVLWACHDEIRRLRQEIQELRNARPKSKNLHGMQKNIPKS